MDALGFLRALLDPDRVAVVGLLAVRPRTVGELSAETGRPGRAVHAAPGPLVQAGIVRSRDASSRCGAGWPTSCTRRRRPTGACSIA